MIDQFTSTSSTNVRLGSTLRIFIARVAVSCRGSSATLPFPINPIQKRKLCRCARYFIIGWQFYGRRWAVAHLWTRIAAGNVCLVRGCWIVVFLRAENLEKARRNLWSIPIRAQTRRQRSTRRKEMKLPKAQDVASHK